MLLTEYSDSLSDEQWLFPCDVSCKAGNGSRTVAWEEHPFELDVDVVEFQSRLHGIGEKEDVYVMYMRVDSCLGSNEVKFEIAIQPFFTYRNVLVEVHWFLTFQAMIVLPS